VEFNVVCILQITILEMTGAGTDPNTDGAVSVVAPGGSYSARLGIQGTGAQAEQLIYSLEVDETNSLFVYRYAVILEDPSHSPAEQPRFEIRVFDENGDSDPCGLYNVYAQENNDGFVSITNQ